MNELANLKTKADLWWQTQRGVFSGVLKNPLFFLLGVRVSQPDSQTVHLKMPWGKVQRILASEVPFSMIVGCAEMALRLHFRQFEVFAPIRVEVVTIEAELPKAIDQAFEFRLKTKWLDWEELRVELAKVRTVDRDYYMPLWGENNSIAGSVKIRTRLHMNRFLPATPK